jgi:NADH-quinone oxidoreductase subunit G
MQANINVHEPKPPDDPDAPLNFSMEGYEGQPLPSLIPRYWAPGWNSVQALNKFQDEVGGPLHGGEPGRRLIEPSPESKISYTREIPDAFVPRQDEFLAVPLYHIFGSEEFSRLSPAIAERIPDTYLAVNPQLAQRLNAVEGQPIEIIVKNNTVRLPLRLEPSLPSGVVGLPVGFPGIPATLPVWAKLELSTEGKEI